MVAGFAMANIYTDGKYLKMALAGKKYFQMAGVAFGAFMLYILIKKNPMRTKEIVEASNDYLKYLPIDRNASNFISPILDFTAKNQYYGGGGGEYDSVDGGGAFNHPVVNMKSEQTILNSGKNNATKRSVSQIKKKYVAANQNWRCAICKEQLTAWFEVDHIQRLEHGGSNETSNLRALCSGCHSEISGMEYI
jgi:hypothetical protein